MSKWLVDIHGELEGDYELICKAESTISLDKVKKARDKIHDAHMKMLDKYRMSNLLIALEILDKLIESEGNND